VFFKSAMIVAMSFLAETSAMKVWMSETMVIPSWIHFIGLKDSNFLVTLYLQSAIAYLANVTKAMASLIKLVTSLLPTSDFIYIPKSTKDERSEIQVLISPIFGSGIIKETPQSAKAVWTWEMMVSKSEMIPVISFPA